ncbi:MAG: hypothetical protein JXR97_00095 [Planctomycetes bacterium]|nr:hypothetical protein [Planctomycetota bacterium]
MKSMILPGKNHNGPYDNVVAIDLETTGADPYSDHIIEVGAAVMRCGEVTERFSEFVSSPVPLSPGIIKLTGINPKMLEGARSVDAVLADFLDFLPEDCLCIAHNAAFERSFLRNATKDRFKNTVIDTVELSRICFPGFSGHSLSLLAELLELQPGGAHRALDDCETLLKLWSKIMERARSMPLAIVKEINYLLATRRGHPYREYFQWLESDILTESFGAENPPLEMLYKAGAVNAQPREIPDPSESLEQIVPEEVDGVLGEDGLFSKQLDNYEKRDGQVEMAHKVSEAYNLDKHLMVEAGTGIGKSLAYIIPSVLMATKNKTPVVLSTNTKNLQSQLYEKDLPLVQEILGLDFKSAILKGRGNYLCLRKLFYVLKQANVELTADERMRLVNVLPWSVWTSTGDISENIVSDRPGFYDVWAKLCTVGDECMGKACAYNGRCFLRKARAKATEADIVVANHSLVFADLNMKNPALPPYQHIVFDEAHNLENAATSHLSVEVSRSRIGFVLGRLYRAAKKKGGTGLLVSIQNQVEADSCKAGHELRAQTIHHLDKAVMSLDEISPAIKNFFSALEHLMEHRSDEGCIRFWGERKRPEQWEPIDGATRALISAMAEIMRAVEAVRDNLKEMESGSIHYQRDFLRDLEASCQWVREITEDLDFVLKAENKEYVYWIEQVTGKMGGVRVMAAPIKIGQLLNDQVYSRKRSVVFSSATMSVCGDFSFIKKRIGVDLIDKNRLIEFDAGTPFNYPEQCLVMVPAFLPEPNERGKDYAAELGVLLSEVFRRSKGRAMGLFTSYSMLSKTSDILNSEMLGDGITILSQGKSGSRESMTATFKRDIHSVLLGTHSFWEGVDVAGEALSCLAIARLPFQVFTDPVIEARREQVEAEGANAFMGYSLPSAVVRFRQGFGRLIRHKTDRGVVIIADTRIVAKRYGRSFRDSIPAPTEAYNNREEFLDAIEEFLA